MAAVTAFIFAPPLPFCSHFCFSRLALAALPKSSIRMQSSPFISFVSNLSIFPLSKGGWDWKSPASAAELQRRSVICMVAVAEPVRKKASSAEKRARQALKRRKINRARKSEIKTRMKKVLYLLEVLQKKSTSEAQPEELLPIQKLMAKAYSTIDKAVQKGTLHWRTGARRKSRLARRLKAVEIHHKWYVPLPPGEQAGLADDSAAAGEQASLDDNTASAVAA